MLETLIILAGVVLLVLVLYWQKQAPWLQRRKEPLVILTYRAWRLHGDGEDCTHPRSSTDEQPLRHDVRRCPALRSARGASVGTVSCATLPAQTSSR